MRMRPIDDADLAAILDLHQRSEEFDKIPSKGNADLAWGMAFVCMGAGCALGPLALRLQNRRAHS